MLKILGALLFILATSFNGFGQSTIQSGQDVFNHLATLSWQTGDGLPYFRDFSGAYGVETYAQVDAHRYAFLSKVTRKILVFDFATHRKIQSVELPFSPVDFTFHQGKYYVAGRQYLWVFDESGRVLTKTFFGHDLLFVDEVKTIGNKVYLISSNQKSWELSSGNRFVAHVGVALKEGLFGKVLKSDAFHFQLLLNSESHEGLIFHFQEKRPLGTVRILGMAGELIFVELQYVVSQQPLVIERRVRALSVKNNKVENRFEIVMPDLQYTYLKHDARICKGALNILISSPEGADIFILNRTNAFKSNAPLKFPKRFYEESYHYNRHLPAINDSTSTHPKSVVQKSITRDEIIKNARPYATHQWYCNEENIKNYDCGGEHVVTPSWVKVGNNVAVPYMWGGFSSIPEFDQGLLNGVSAGDSYTHGNGAGSYCAVGVDCSGFVSQVWELSNKYSTASIPQISTAYASYDQLLPGDVVNYPHHHVRLIHSNNGNGSFLIIEAAASGTDWRVGYNNYTTADFEGRYIPRHYNYLTNVPRDTVKPTTRVQVNSWQASDFKVNFEDHDNRSLNERFYQVSYFNGTRWTANPQKGFFYDDFSAGLDSSWMVQSGQWTVNNGKLIQSDESLSNPNIYTAYHQEAGAVYLIRWRMKIGGSGSNRRAGLFFMSDNPTFSQRNNAYMIYFRVDDDRCQIYKSSGNSIGLETSDFCKVDPDVWFDAKVIFNTNTGEMRVYKDDQLVSSWIDAQPLTSGNSLSLRTGNALVAYDDFKAFRSRGDTAWVGVGKNQSIPVQNTTPSQPVGLIYSLVSDSANQLSQLDSALVGIDTTAPSGFVVWDGLDKDYDTAYTVDQLSARWTPSVDSNSGIASYFYAIGKQPYQNEVVDWTEIQSPTYFTLNGLSLESDSTYFVSVMAENLSGLFSDIMVSNGVRVITPNAVGLHPVQAVTCYPNPANQFLMVVALQQPKHPQVFNLQGQRMAVTLEALSDNKWKINTASLHDGTYFLFCEVNHQRKMIQFCVVH